MWPLEILGYASIYITNGEIGYLVEQKEFSGNRPLPVQIRFMKKIFALLVLAGSLARAENVVVGQLIDDPDFLFSSFGDQYTRGTTRGANFGGSDVTWYGVAMSSTSGANGISWAGLVATGSQYSYSSIYSGTSPGTGATADNLTNTGIYGGSTSIQISATAGATYLVDLLFANQFSGSGSGYVPYRIFDVRVGGLLYADELMLPGTNDPSRRPLVYRFEVTPSSGSIDITFAGGVAIPGVNTDTTPYVNAVMVTQVPEPSSGVLLLVGMAALLRRRNRK